MAKTDVIASNAWGLVVTQGVIAILAGIALLFWPGISVAVISLLVGVFVLLWGIVGLVRSLIGIGKLDLWWVELLFSILLIGVGVFLLRNTELALALLILLIGMTFIVRGVVDLIQGLFNKDSDVRDARALYIILGIIGILAGILTLLYPVGAGVTFIWVAGLYAVVYGAILLAISIRTRQVIA